MLFVGKPFILINKNVVVVVWGGEGEHFFRGCLQMLEEMKNDYKSSQDWNLPH